MSSSENPHKVGERCYFETFKGTIRYVGDVPPTNGMWYGVEWDDERGKHDGTSNNVRYFKCKDKHGSFVRPHKIQFGVSATESLQKEYGIGKYEEDEPIVLNKETNQETKIIMVGFNKIAAKQSDFTTLRKVDLSGCNISHANLIEGLDQILPNVNCLTLLGNLLSSLKDVFLIASKLQTLDTLNLSDNRITDFDMTGIERKESFAQVKTLYVNYMHWDWEQLLQILKNIPSVVHVHACFNDITDIRYDEIVDKIETLNLEGNCIKSWESMLQLSSLKRLKRLILNENKIDDIVIPSEQCFAVLESLSLNNNDINKWKSINELDKLKCLSEIRCRNNPISKDIPFSSLRQELISRLEHVTASNGSKIEDKERQLAGIAYIKKYSLQYFQSKTTNTMDDFERKHPRYSKLIAVHGAPQNEEQMKMKSLKENLLFALTETIVLEIKCPDCSTKKSIQKNVPGTMTIQQLKGILQRQYKVPNSKQKLSYIDTENSREIELEDNLKQLTYYSVSSGDTVLLRW